MTEMSQNEICSVLCSAYTDKLRARVQFRDNSTREGKIDYFERLINTAVKAEDVPAQFKFAGDVTLYATPAVVAAGTLDGGG